MDRFSATSLLQRSSTLRLAARAGVFGLFAWALIVTARLIQSHITTEPVWATIGLVIALVVLESALVVVVNFMFKKVP